MLLAELLVFLEVFGGIVVTDDTGVGGNGLTFFDDDLEWSVW